MIWAGVTSLTIPEGEVAKIIANGIELWSNAVPFLEVSPTEVQWLTPDSNIVYDVTSNVDWIIE